MLLVNPVAGVITSGYDPARVHPVLERVVPHYGTDIGGRPRGGTHWIGAALAGRVIYVRTNSHAGDTRGGYLPRLTGNQVVIDHGVIDGQRLVTYYGHFDDVVVDVGDEVTAGQRLGTQGATGNVDGAHLHLEVWVDGQTVNPATFFSRRGIVLGSGPTTPIGAVMAKLDDDDYSEIARHVWEFKPREDKRSAWTLLKGAWDKSVKTNSAVGRTERVLSALGAAARKVYPGAAK